MSAATGFLREIWTGDLDLMASAGVPEDRRAARSNRGIAIAEIDRVRKRSVRFRRVLPDAGFGSSSPFRQALSERGLRWVVGITGCHKVHPADMAMIFPVVGRGRPRQHHLADQVSIAAETTLADMADRAVIWRHGTKGRLRSRFCALRVRMAAVRRSGAISSY